HFGAAGRGDPGRVVEHPDRHAVLLVSLDVAEEACDRRVHGQRDVRLAGQLAEPLRELVVHPELPLEVELAGRVAALEDRADGVLRALRGRAARWPDADGAHRRSLPVPLRDADSAHNRYTWPRRTRATWASQASLPSDAVSTLKP